MKTIQFSEAEYKAILKALMIRMFYFDDETATEEQRQAEKTAYEKIRFDNKIEPFPGV